MRARTEIFCIVVSGEEVRCANVGGCEQVRWKVDSGKFLLMSEYVIFKIFGVSTSAKVVLPEGVVPLKKVLSSTCVGSHMPLYRIPLVNVETVRVVPSVS